MVYRFLLINDFPTKFKRRIREAPYFSLFSVITIFIVFTYNTLSSKTSEYVPKCLHIQPQTIVGIKEQDFVLGQIFINSNTLSNEKKWQQLPAMINRIWAFAKDDVNKRLLTPLYSNTGIAFMNFLNKGSVCNIFTSNATVTTIFKWGAERTTMPIENTISKMHRQCNFVRMEIARQEFDKNVWDGFSKYFVFNEDKDALHLGLHDAHRFEGALYDRLDIMRFAFKQNRSSHIDSLIIDNEGAEILFLEYIAANLNKLPVMCQIHLKIYYPQKDVEASLKNFFHHFHLLIRYGVYAVLNTNLDKTTLHLQILLVNIKDSLCIEKFICIDDK